MRTQIALEPEHHAQAERKAAALGVSTSEYIQQLVERDLSSVGTRSDISAIFGLGNSGSSDIAADRQSATAEAIEAHWQKQSR